LGDLTDPLSIGGGVTRKAACAARVAHFAAFQVQFAAQPAAAIQQTLNCTDCGRAATIVPPRGASSGMELAWQAGPMKRHAVLTYGDCTGYTRHARWF
jgi:hypothetical protein